MQSIAEQIKTTVKTRCQHFKGSEYSGVPLYCFLLCHKLAIILPPPHPFLYTTLNLKWGGGVYLNIQLILTVCFRFLVILHARLTIKMTSTAFWKNGSIVPYFFDQSHSYYLFCCLFVQLLFQGGYYRSVPQRHPPFCNLSLSTKCRGGLYTGCDIFSCD